MTQPGIEPRSPGQLANTLLSKLMSREMYKRLNSDHTTKWYKHKSESVLEIETHKIQWDIEIQTEHRISARISDSELINKKERNCRLVDFVVPADHSMKKESKISK